MGDKDWDEEGVRTSSIREEADLFEFPILSFELVIFVAELPRVLRILYRGRGERLVGRNGGRTHDDVSVYGRGGRGKHCGGPGGHGGRRKKREGN